MSICDNMCDLPSSPNDMKILLKQIKLEVDNLVKETEAKLLLHDGKIAEVCRYVKDNLANTLRCMIADMEATGELDNLIKEAVSQAWFELENKVIILENKLDFSKGLYEDLLNENGGVL